MKGWRQKNVKRTIATAAFGLALLCVPAQSGTMKKPQAPAVEAIPKPSGIDYGKVPRANLCGKGEYPDLTIPSVVLKKSDDFVITIKNESYCTAPASQLGPFIGKNESETRNSLAFYKYWLPVPALGAYASTTINWPANQGTYGLVYIDKKYVFRFEADFSHKIKESDEYNNDFIVKP
jgi:hypothetical protein